MSRFRKHLKAGTKVELHEKMGLLEDGRNYCSGLVDWRDGGDYYIRLDYKGIIVHRYLSEIKTAFIDGKWVNDNT